MIVKKYQLHGAHYAEVTENSNFQTPLPDD